MGVFWCYGGDDSRMAIAGLFLRDAGQLPDNRQSAIGTDK